jgi:hypothetical protein
MEYDDCDDCGLESDRNGNHATDADCMAALRADRDRFRTALERLVKHTGCGTDCPAPCPAKEAVELLGKTNEEDE